MRSRPISYIALRLHNPPSPPRRFLHSASLVSIEDLELASLNRASNLSKTIRTELDQWVEQRAIALYARWVRENRRRA